MISAEVSAAGRPWVQGLLIGAVALLVVGCGSIAVGVGGSEEQAGSSAETAIVSPPATDGTFGARAVGAGPVVGRSEPAELRIPAIGVSVPVSSLGLNADRTVEVPTDFALAGWFRLGPTPGQVGSAVILGHVDSVQGPAVFFRLRTLHAGDAVEVTSDNGDIARFTVTGVATYPKDQFPAEKVYAPHGDSSLQLVTCGGEFDSSTGSYRSNVVVYTSLVGITPAPDRTAGG